MANAILRALVAKIKGQPKKVTTTGQTVGPYDLTIGKVVAIPDPNANSNNTSTAVQLQNASPFVLSVVAGGDTFTIQSFAAQTITMPSAGGQPVQVTPETSNVSGTLTTYQKGLTAVFLMAGQTSPMADGPISVPTFSKEIVILKGTSDGSTPIVETIQLSPLWSSIWVLLTPDVGLDAIQCLGLQSGVVYQQVDVPDLASDVGTLARFFVLPVDTSVQLTMDPSGDSQWWIGADLGESQVAIYASSVDGRFPVTPPEGFTVNAVQQKVAVTGTAVALPTLLSVTPVNVRALPGNANPVALGPSTVTVANGYVLGPGEDVTLYPHTGFLGNLYVNGTAGDGVSAIGLD